MTSNVLVSIWNLVKYGERDISHYDTTYKISINKVGEPFEYYIKDSFAGSYDKHTIPEKEQAHKKVFSYLGAQNNPPDFIVKKGDSFEVKKKGGKAGAVALNSSIPKSVLRVDDHRILEECRNCEGEPWEEKDLYYIIGRVNDNIVEHVFYVHGKCYAASHEVYDSVIEPIKAILTEQTKGRQTTELGKIKEIGPLKNADLRIRGMWNIDHPVKVFKEYYSLPNVPFAMAALLLEKKYNNYPDIDRRRLEGCRNIQVEKVHIKDPNDSTNRVNAVLITYPASNLS